VPGGKPTVVMMRETKESLLKGPPLAGRGITNSITPGGKTNSKQQQHERTKNKEKRTEHKHENRRRKKRTDEKRRERKKSVWLAYRYTDTHFQ
jgi:hypothetical protein